MKKKLKITWERNENYCRIEMKLEAVSIGVYYNDGKPRDYVAEFYGTGELMEFTTARKCKSWLESEANKWIRGVMV